MNDIPNNLHWSVDYAHHHSSNTDYQRQLLLLLEKSLCDSNIGRDVNDKKTSLYNLTQFLEWLSAIISRPRHWANNCSPESGKPIYMAL